jgi:4TM region of DNA translocase FtsK/SpoIIIE
MEWVSRRRIGLTAGFVTAALCFVAICSFAPQDPTFTNLRYPKDGIANWLGYPGALTGGSLVELFGWAALLLPFAIAYWTLCPGGRPRGWRYMLQSGMLMMLGAAWIGQWSADPGLGLAGPGLAGWSGGQWMHETLGAWIGGLLLTAGLALSLWHQVYAPGFRAALKDIRAVVRLFSRDGRVQAREWLHARTAQAAVLRTGVVATVALIPLQALGGVSLRIGHAVQRGIVAPARAVVERVRGSAASLASIKARTASAPLPPRRKSERVSERMTAEPSLDGSAFDGWLEDDAAPALPKPTPTAPQIRAPIPEPRPQRSGGLADFENTTWRNPADEPLYDSRPGAPDSQENMGDNRPSGAERLSAASATARELQSEAAPQRLPDVRPSPERRPTSLPPAGSGKERWEQLLQRYRENLDLDWDEQGWRGKDQLGGEGESGPATTRRPPK